MALAVLAQLFGVVAGPLDHWRNSTRMGPHFEEAGSTQSHYAHDEAKCVACAINHVTASPARRPFYVPLLLGNRPALRTEHVPSPASVLRTQTAPRAPPAFVFAG